MGIFSSIKDFLFGKQFVTIGHGQPQKPQVQPQAAQPTQAQAPQAAAPQAQPQQQGTTAVQERVDIAAILDQEAAQAGQKLNWRNSIVDLMKLTGIDPSLQNREQLAKELGYTGSLDGSAAMNMWLHKAVMNKLEQDGGKVPQELK